MGNGLSNEGKSWKKKSHSSGEAHRASKLAEVPFKAVFYLR